MRRAPRVVKGQGEPTGEAEACADPKGPGLRGGLLHRLPAWPSPVSKLVEAMEMSTFRTRNMDKEMTGPFLEILIGLQGFFHDNGERKT